MAVALTAGWIATSRAKAWSKFVNQPHQLQTKEQLQKRGFRVRCFHLTFEVVE
jgi:hypothetical protein